MVAPAVATTVMLNLSAAETKLASGYVPHELLIELNTFTKMDVTVGRGKLKVKMFTFNISAGASPKIARLEIVSVPVHVAFKATVAVGASALDVTVKDWVAVPAAATRTGVDPVILKPMYEPALMVALTVAFVPPVLLKVTKTPKDEPLEYVPVPEVYWIDVIDTVDLAWRSTIAVSLPPKPATRPEIASVPVHVMVITAPASVEAPEATVTCMS